MSSWPTSLLLLGVGVLIGAVLMAGVEMAAGDEGRADTLLRTTPTPCENFYQASAFLAGAAGPQAGIQSFILTTTAAGGAPTVAEKSAQLQALFERCVEFAR